MTELRRIESHKNLKKIQVKVKGHYSPLCYHTYADVYVGDEVELLGGVYKGRNAIVVETDQREIKWEGYTYEAKKAPVPVKWVWRGDGFPPMKDLVDIADNGYEIESIEVVESGKFQTWNFIKTRKARQ